MKDIPAFLGEKKARAAELLGRTFGPGVDLDQVAKAITDGLPSPSPELQKLCIFYEQEMIRCREGQAYFAACLAGAAMIESFLLLFCIYERKNVQDTIAFRKHSKGRKPYEALVAKWTLKDLIPIAMELGWIRKEIDGQLVDALVSMYREIASVMRPDITVLEIESGAASLKAHPDTALFGLMQDLRNLVHAGRWVRLKRAFVQATFVEWTRLVLALTADIRDCLILRLEAAQGRYLDDLLRSPEGSKWFAEILETLARTRQAAPNTGTAGTTSR